MPATIEICEGLYSGPAVIKQDVPPVADIVDRQHEARNDLLQMISHRERGRHLAELEEALGDLIKVQEYEGNCIAVFKWGSVALPRDLKDELAPLVGRKAGILKLNARFREYHIRELF